MAHLGFGGCLPLFGALFLPSSFALLPVLIQKTGGHEFLGRPLRYLIFSLMALIGDPICIYIKYFSKGFRGQPRFSVMNTGRDGSSALRVVSGLGFRA